VADELAESRGGNEATGLREELESRRREGERLRVEAEEDREERRLA